MLVGRVGLVRLEKGGRFCGLHWIKCELKAMEVEGKLLLEMVRFCTVICWLNNHGFMCVWCEDIATHRGILLIRECY